MKKTNQIITNDYTLKEFNNKCLKQKVLAIDTEFIRDNTYYPILCLVQIAGEDFAAAIDPLSGIDMKPIWDLLSNENILKVFHSGRQDIEIFFNLTGKIPKPIYDTQIASMFCGMGDQVGYERLVDKFLGLSINKENQFTNWLQRPLTKCQLDYAISDETVINIGLNHAVVLIGENSEKLGKVLGDHPDGNGKVLAKSGRFGPYVEYNKIRATLPKSISIEEISLDQAIELIIAKAAKPPRTKKKTVKKK